MASVSGMVDQALSLVQHAASQGVPGLDEIAEDLLLFSRLVYDASGSDGEGAEEEDGGLRGTSRCFLS